MLEIYRSKNESSNRGKLSKTIMDEIKNFKKVLEQK